MTAASPRWTAWLRQWTQDRPADRQAGSLPLETYRETENIFMF